MAPDPDQLAALGLAPPPSTPMDSGAESPAVPPIVPFDPSRPLHTPSGVIDPIVKGGEITKDKTVADRAGLLAQHGLINNDLGKEAFHAGMPKIADVTDDPASLRAFYVSRQNQLEYKQAHPWGSPVSEHPGILGKIGHVAGEIGNIAGSAIAPGITANIPGSTLNNQRMEARNMRGIEQGSQEEERAAQTTNLENQPELRAAQLGIKQGELANAQEKTSNQHEDNLRKLGLNAEGKPIPYDQLSGKEQAVEDLKGAQTEAQEANAALAKAKADPNSPAFRLAQQRLQAALANAQTARERLGLSEQEFANKVNEQDLIKPSGQAQSRGSAAQAALDVLPDLENAVRANAKDLGPILGRLARGEIAIGNVDPKIVDLYSKLNSFYALQPAIHGFRNYQLVKDMPSLIGGLSRDPEGTIAGIEGLKGTMQSVAKEGKTFHRREVEPAAGGGNAPPAGAKVRDFSQLQ